MLALAGPICAGKTSIAKALARDFGYEALAVRTLLERAVGQTGLTREALQREGARLETETRGSWIADAAARLAAASRVPIVVDAIRTVEQGEALRKRFRTELRLVYVTAAVEERRRRFEARQRKDPRDREASFETVTADPLESGVSAVLDIADFALDTTELAAKEAARCIAGE